MYAFLMGHYLIGIAADHEAVGEPQIYWNNRAMIVVLIILET